MICTGELPFAPSVRTAREAVVLTAELMAFQIKTEYAPELPALTEVRVNVGLVPPAMLAPSFRH